MRAIDADTMKADLKLIALRHTDDAAFVKAAEIFAKYIDEQPTTDPVNHCASCDYWHSSPSQCPMCHDEWFEDDGYSECMTVDNTLQDGSGFCDRYHSEQVVDE